MGEKKTNGGKIGTYEKIGNLLETIRNRFADFSMIVLWFGKYFAFVIVICLVSGSIWGILNATLEMWEIIEVQTPDGPKDGDHRLYPNLIMIAKYYLISFTLLLIAIGIQKITSGVISKTITKIEHLESLMIGFVVITMAFVFLDTIFGVARGVTVGVESVLIFGLAMTVVIVGLALYLKFRENRREKPSESEVPIDEVTDKVFTKEEKEEIYKKLKEELKKAIEERREDDAKKIVRLIDSIKKIRD